MDASAAVYRKLHYYDLKVEVIEQKLLKAEEKHNYDYYEALVEFHGGDRTKENKLAALEVQYRLKRVAADSDVFKAIHERLSARKLDIQADKLKCKLIEYKKLLKKKEKEDSTFLVRSILYNNLI